MARHAFHGASRIALIPSPIEVFSGGPELRHEESDRSSGSTSARFSRHRRSRAASSSFIIVPASDLPMKKRRGALVFNSAWHFLLLKFDNLLASEADVVLVAMGNPAQEMWLTYNLEAMGCRLGFGVGALFDFLSGDVARAPRWVRAGTAGIVLSPGQGAGAAAVAALCAW
jgi:hypothetical protein